MTVGHHVSSIRLVFIRLARYPSIESFIEEQHISYINTSQHWLRPSHVKYAATETRTRCSQKFVLGHIFSRICCQNIVYQRNLRQFIQITFINNLAFGRKTTPNARVYGQGYFSLWCFFFAIERRFGVGVIISSSKVLHNIL